MKDLEIWSIAQLETTFRSSEKTVNPDRGRLFSHGFRPLVRTIFIAGWVFGLALLSTGKTFAQADFRVEGAGVEASPTSYNGACPGVIKFTAKIQANGQGRVKYTWLRSDNATAPVEYVDFTGPGVKYVSTTWTLGDARVLPNYSGWQQLRILSPNEYLSNKAEFKLTCRQSQPQTCGEQSRLVSWAQKFLGGDGNGVHALAAPDARTNTLGAMQVGAFGGGRAYPGLAALLGVSDAVLARADVIAFELNGGSPGESGGFESGRWVFIDGVNPPHEIDFDATRDWRTIPGVIANGTIGGGSTREVSGANYSRFFGIVPETDVFVSYILFDLPPAVDASAPSFSVKVSSFAGAGEASPDVDAIGVLSCAPPAALEKK